MMWTPFPLGSVVLLPRLLPVEDTGLKPHSLGLHPVM